MTTRRLVAASLALTLVASPAFAAGDKAEDPQALATEGMQNLMRAMEMLLLSIPQFEAPYMNENGDIIIRRKNPQKEPDVPRQDSPEGGNRKAI